MYIGTVNMAPLRTLKNLFSMDNDRLSMVDVNDLTQKAGIKDQSTISNNNRSGFESTNDKQTKAIENNIKAIGDDRSIRRTGNTHRLKSSMTKDQQVVKQ